MVQLDSPIYEFLLAYNSNHMSISHRLAIAVTRKFFSYPNSSHLLIVQNFDPTTTTLPRGVLFFKVK